MTTSANVREQTIRRRNLSRGFLPQEDPLICLSGPSFAPWEAVAQDLSKLALSDYIRPTIEALPPFPVSDLQTTRGYERAMTMLACMASLYVYAPGHKPVNRLPKHLAMAWYEVATYLQRPPMLAYAVHGMYNWRRIDPAGPIAVGNLTLIQNFLGGMDEEWFVTLHINIEAVAGRALSVLLPAQDAVLQDDSAALTTYLQTIAETLEPMYDLLGRMPERCDPNVYYHRVRPYMFGWKDNPDMPGGMLYEGVEAYGGQPQGFRGGTGAQSSIIPAFDAALGVAHEFDTMRAYLMEMRDYMPRQDRDFIELLEQGPSIRAYVQQHKMSAPKLRAAYNEAIHKLHQFRQRHIEYAAMYILKPAQGEKKAAVGTGGTPFTVYLKKHIDETLRHLI